MTATLLEREDSTTTVTETTSEAGRAAHIVFIPQHLKNLTSPQAWVLAAMVEGFEVEALCGYRWIPSRDPKALPVCEECLSIYHDSDRDDRDQLPDA